MHLSNGIKRTCCAPSAAFRDAASCEMHCTLDKGQVMTDKNFEQMEMFAWWGVPTLFRCELERDPTEVDIGLIGVPHSSGNGWNERDQHFGPRALRDVSMGYRRVHREFKLSPWNECRVRDMGDAPLPNAMHNDQTIKDIQAFYMPLVAAGVKPVSIGGDHSITLPILRALVSSQSTVVNQPLAMVHFDAHHDSYDASDYGDKFLGNVEWAGAWAKIMCDEGLVDPKKVIQIGMRGHMDAETEGNFSEKAGYRVIEALEFHKRGPESVFKEIREIIGDTPVYITFDLDSLDPLYAPGVSNIEPGYPGLSMWDVMQVLHGMRGMNVIGGDVVCPMPTKDHANKITSINAAVILFEQICLIAERAKQSAALSAI